METSPDEFNAPVGAVISRRGTAVDDPTAGCGSPPAPVGDGTRAPLWSRETRHASTSSSRYQDFENGRTGLLLDRVRRFADILKLDQFAILAAFHLGKPRIAHAFAHNKFLLIQASAVDEFDEETQDAIAAVDPLTMLDAHIQFYRQVAEHGRTQLRAAEGRRAKD